MFAVNTQHTDIIILIYDYVFLTKVAGSLANVRLMAMSDCSLSASLVQFVALKPAFYISIQQVKLTEWF
jgi:hypothetical protein